MAKKFTVSTIYKAVNQMTRPLRQMKRQVESFTRGATRNMRKLSAQTQDATDKMMGLGKSALAAGAFVGTALAAASRAGIDFEHTLNLATAKMAGDIRRGTDEYRQLEEVAKNVGATTRFTAVEAAQGIEYLALAGFNAQQAMAALPQVVDLATAANVDLASASDIATDSLGALGLMTQDSIQLGKNLQRVNDVLAKTTSSSNTNMEQLFETIRKGGPAATAAGQSLETVAAMAGVMANNGIKAEVAGTALQNFFLRLAAPVGESEKLLKRLGITVSDSAGNMRDAFDIVGDLNKALEGMGEQQRLAIIQKIFGSEGLAGNLAIINAGKKGMDDYRKVLEGATGAASKMAKVINDDTRGSIRTLQSVVESVSIRFFELSGTSIRGVIDQTTAWITKNREVIAQNLAGTLNTIIENFDEIVRAIKLVGAVMVTLWAFNTVVKTITGAMMLFNLVVTANPIVLMVMAAIAAIAALAAAIYIHWDPIKEYFTELWASLGRGFDAFASTLSRTFDIVFGPIIASIEWMVEQARALGDMIGGGDSSDPVSPYSQVAGGYNVATATPSHGYGAARGLIMPEERQAVAMSQHTEKRVVELNINDPQGRTEIGGKQGSDDGIVITKTGAF